MDATEHITEDEVTTADELQLTDEEKTSVDAMIEAGVLHGRKHSFSNPKMGKFVFGVRKGVDVFDIFQTGEFLKKAGLFLKKLKDEKKQVIVVCTKPALRDLAKEFALEHNFLFVIERWLGGTLTNYKTIGNRVEALKKLKLDKEKGLLKKYTKKEQLMIDREIEKMAVIFEGVETLVGLPAAIFVIDSLHQETAVHEANILKIPVVGLINTDGNPDVIQYPIPCNDNARGSVTFVLKKISEYINGIVK